MTTTATTGRRILRRCFLLPLSRTFSSRYRGRIVRTDPTGRDVAVELNLPEDLVRDGRGYVLPRRDLVCRVSSLLNNRKLDDDPLLNLSDYLRSLALSLTPAEVSEILKSARSPQKAIDFFKFCSSLPNFRHNCFTYNRLLLLLSRSSSSSSSTSGEVARVLDDMKREGVRGNISTVNLLIGIVGPEELDGVLKLAAKWGLMFNRYTYKCLLQSHLRAGEIQKALGVHNQMRRKGYALDIFAYNMLLDGLAKDDMVQEAYKVFADMKHRHCEPDMYTYTILIRMAGRIGKVDESLSLFDEMSRKCCPLNLIAYNTLIQVLAKHRMVDKTILIFSQMIGNDCRPNDFTFKFILEVLAAECRLDRLDEVIEISNRFMNRSLYSFIVKTLKKLGHANVAHGIFCRMWNFHESGDKDAYFSILESLCEAGKTSEAIDLLNMIRDKEGVAVTADTVMYNMVLGALGKLKQISSSSTLFEAMKHKGPPPDLYTYNILISSFGKVGDLVRATQLFDEMECCDCKPDVVTYNALINSLGKNGDVEEAHMRFKEMQEKGLAPDVVTYSTLIECFGKSGRVEMANKLFGEMVSVGCCPNIVTYNILLDCLEKNGKTDEAFKVLAKLKQQGLTPDSITYAIIERLQRVRVGKVSKHAGVSGWASSPL